MRMKIHAGMYCCALTAGVLMLMPLRAQQASGGQQSKGAVHASGGQNGTSPSSVRQEFGPMRASGHRDATRRRGGRTQVRRPRRKPVDESR